MSDEIKVPGLWRIERCVTHVDYDSDCLRCREEVLTTKTENAYRAGFKAGEAQGVWEHAMDEDAYRKEQDRLHREQRAWLERHTKDADFLICDTRTGQCTEATYYSPMKKARDSQEAYLKAFFQAVAEEEARRGGPDV